MAWRKRRFGWKLSLITPYPMKTKITALLLLGLGFLIAGCNSASNMNKVRIGMTKDEVLTILGQPDSTSAQANVEYLTYYLIADTSYYGRDQPYMVRLVNGKVESFGRFAQLFDLYNRPVTGAIPGDANFPAPQIGATTVVRVPPAADVASELEKLAKLKEQGVLSDAEFQAAKAKLLAEQK